MYFICCEFEIQFDNNFNTHLKTNYEHNREIEKISQCLLYCIKCTALKGYKYKKIYSIDYLHT